ncbi:MAG: hypothetical protein EA369_03840 [Bradymonadales bacterium]|nr:MAG: hypothetical protein EA369_03840 [Bradymonadales bacterium]
MISDLLVGRETGKAVCLDCTGRGRILLIGHRKQGFNARIKLVKPKPQLKLRLKIRKAIHRPKSFIIECPLVHMKSHRSREGLG